MIVELCNSGTEPFTVELQDHTEILQPCQQISISMDSDTVDIKLLHQKSDKFNAWWYLLHAIFALKQMRTELVIDGKYQVKSKSDVVRIKVKDYEYIFHKNFSYQVFVFSVDEGTISPQRLNVAHRNKILNRAKFLYLFGGIKTLLPITGIAVLIAISLMVDFDKIPRTDKGSVIFVFVSFVLLLANYIKSLKFLRKCTTEEYVFQYLSSERKEHRRESDDIVQKYRDVNAGDEVYW